MKTASARPTIPGKVCGRITLRNVCVRVAPRSIDASTSARSRLSTAAYSGRNMNGTMMYTIPSTTAAGVYRISSGAPITPTPISTLFRMPEGFRISSQACSRTIRLEKNGRVIRNRKTSFHRSGTRLTRNATG